MALSKTDQTGTDVKNDKTDRAALAAGDTARSASDAAAAPHVSHTPGTWTVFVTDDDDQFAAFEVVIDDNGPGRSVIAVLEDQPEVVGNAHLIAAAPDLLDALKAIVEYDPNHGPSHHGTKENYEWYGRSPQVWKNAEAAIKKAEGLRHTPSRE